MRSIAQCFGHGGVSRCSRLSFFFVCVMLRSFSCINGPLADRLISELRGDFSPDMDVRDLDKKQIHQITALFRQAKFPMPDANVSDTMHHCG
jgi:hypothetical protein